MKRRLELVVNGQRVEREAPARMTLLEFLRQELYLTGTKCGCGNGECGACTVILDGNPVRSCLILAVEANASSVVTIEGLAGNAALDPVQQAFIDSDAIQCGYCSPGFILAVYALLQRCPNPDQTQIEEALGGHLCRCTGYEAIYDAVLRAVELRHGGSDATRKE